MKIEHGTTLGGPNGEAYQVFAPPWWKITAWVLWLFLKRSGKTPVGTVSFFDAEGNVQRVRVVRSNVRVPGVPSPETVERHS